MPQQPRVTVEFSDWNLEAAPTEETFHFNKPSDAKQIEFLKMSGKAAGGGE